MQQYNIEDGHLIIVDVAIDPYSTCMHQTHQVRCVFFVCSSPVDQDGYQLSDMHNNYYYGLILHYILGLMNAEQSTPTQYHL